MPLDGDAVLALLGSDAEAPGVTSLLDSWARGMRPDLEDAEPEDWFDWILLPEIGLKLGFTDRAFLGAEPDDLRGAVPLVFSDAWFFAESDDTARYPGSGPFGVALGDPVHLVRRRLEDVGAAHRSWINDSWLLADGTRLTASWDRSGSTLSWLYARKAEQPWIASGPSLQWSPDRFSELFGLRWSSLALRRGLQEFEVEGRLGEVRRENLVDLRREHGVELSFAPGRRISGVRPRDLESLVFAAVTWYAARELDSREWTGPLPFGLAFADSQAELGRKVAAAPALHHDTELSGYAVWHFERASLQVLYSNLDNRLLRVTLMAPGYWPA